MTAEPTQAPTAGTSPLVAASKGLATKEGRAIFEIQADLIAMFANSRRLMIMDFLDEGEKSVGEIAEALDFPLQNVSQHLRIMKDRGVVAARRVGQTVYYRVTNPKFIQCCRLARSAIVEELARRGDLAALAPGSSGQGRQEVRE